MAAPDSNIPVGIAHNKHLKDHANSLTMSHANARLNHAGDNILRSHQSSGGGAIRGDVLEALSSIVKASAAVGEEKKGAALKPYKELVKKETMYFETAMKILQDDSADTAELRQEYAFDVDGINRLASDIKAYHSKQITEESFRKSLETGGGNEGKAMVAGKTNRGGKAFVTP